MHGDGGEAVQGPEHVSIEGVPGNRGKLLRDRGLGAGAHFLTIEPGGGRGEKCGRADGLAVGDSPPPTGGLRPPPPRPCRLHAKRGPGTAAPGLGPEGSSGQFRAQQDKRTGIYQ